MMRIPIDAARQYSALALIRVDEGPNQKYLLQWNAKWKVFNLIGGKLDNSQGDNDSLARTIYREIEEELGLRGEEECLILNQIMSLEMRQFSLREQRVKDYYFAIFEVDLFPRLPIAHDQRIYAVRWLSTGRENIFVSKDEVRQLRTAQGHPISTTTKAILVALGELGNTTEGTAIEPLLT